MKYLISILSLFFLSQTLFAQNKDMVSPGNTGLKPFYISDDKGAYYVSNKGANVFWVGEHPGKQYAHVFKGKKEGKFITGNWWSVTKYKSKAKGKVKLRISKMGDLLTVVEQTGAFPVKTLKVNRISRVVNQLPKPKRKPAYSAAKGKGLTGAFLSTDGTMVAYSRQIGNRIVLFGETRFTTGKRPKRVFAFVGTKRQRGIIVGQAAYVSKGIAKGSGSVRFKISNEKLTQIGLGGAKSYGLSLGPKNWKRVRIKTHSGAGSSKDQAALDKLPKKPKHIELERNNYYVVLDFTRTVEGMPMITLPQENLPELPIYNNKIVFPDNFCGLRIRKPARYYWVNQSGKVLNNATYNSMPKGKYLEDVNFETWYDGIEFTGPIGACKKSNDDWKFPTPLTKTGKINWSYGKVKLVIETLNPTEIEFLNYHLKKPKPLKVSQMYKEFKNYAVELLKKEIAKNETKVMKKAMKEFCKKNRKVCEFDLKVCKLMPELCKDKS